MLFPWYIKYPNQNDEILNLDWILSTIDNLVKEVADFVTLNTIKYADPIQWNITTQYEKNTVVIDPITGSAYISTKPVPAGVGLNNTDYWNIIFTLDVISSNKNITLRDDANNMLATFESEIGDWLLWQGTLYVVTKDIEIGQAYVDDYNIERATVESFIKLYIGNTLDYINTLVGDLDDLSTTDKSNIVAAINEIVSSVITLVGDLDDLATTDKSNLVAAINEVLSTLSTKIGDLSELPTSDKSSLVAAIDEVNEKIPNILYVNVKDYGATGDGLTDDTAAFNAAITAAGNNSNIFVPAGRYLISGLSIPTSTGIVGSGPQSILICVDNTKPVISYTVTNLDAINIRNLALLRSTPASSADTNAHGIKLASGSNGQGCLLENLFIRDQYHGIVTSATIAGSTMRDILVTDCYGDGYNFTEGTWYVYNLLASKCNNGFIIKPSSAPIAGFYLTGCTAYRTKNAGFMFDGTSYGVYDVQLNNCVCSCTRGGGFKFYGSGANQNIMNCFSEYAGYADENKSDPNADTSASGIFISNHSSVIITALTEFESNNMGINLNNADSVIISDSNIINNVSFNIYIAGGCDNVRIHDSILTSSVSTIAGVVTDDTGGTNTKIELHDLDVTGCTTPLNIATAANTRLHNIAGYTPTITQPTLASGDTITNPYPFDMFVMLRGSLTGLVVENSLGVANPLDCNDFILRKGKSFYLTFSGTVNCSWYPLL